MPLSAPAPGLRRVETSRGHKYYLDGRYCPGVTTLIGQGIPKPALISWAARTVAEHVYHMDPDELMAAKARPAEHTVNDWKRAPDRQRNTAAARGTEVHGYAEKLVHGADVDVPEHLAGYVQAAVAFMDEWRIAPVAVEACVGSREHWYCGTVDLIADLPDGRRALMDYKTSKSGIYPEAAVQLAAYRNAEFMGTDGNETPLADLGINCAYAVWLRPDGYSVIPLHTGPEVFRCFLTAATTAGYVKTMSAWVGAPESWSVPA